MLYQAAWSKEGKCSKPTAAPALFYLPDCAVYSVLIRASTLKSSTAGERQEPDKQPPSGRLL